MTSRSTVACSAGAASGRRRARAARLRAAAQHDDSVAVDARVVLLFGQPEVDAVVGGECGAEEPLHLVRMTRDVDRPAGQRRQRGDVSRRHVRRAVVRAVVRRAGADEQGACALMAEVELHLLVRPLDEEGRERVHDRPVALERKAGRHPDHELLANADVEASRVLGNLACPDRREHDGDALVVLECLCRKAVEAAAHRHGRTSATTHVGRPPESFVDSNASASAAWSRPSTRCTCQSSTSKRRSTPPGQRCVSAALSMTIAVSESSPCRPAYCTASQLLPSSSSPSPTRQ